MVTPCCFFIFQENYDMKKNKFGFPEKTSAGKSKDALHLENEILRIKLKAQTGKDLHYDGGTLPPEIENIFLKNILAFEESFSRSKLISVFDFLDRPAFRKAAELNDEELDTALSEISDLLFRKQITLDFCNLHDNRAKYKFITEDLFLHEVHDIRMPGTFLHFIYEEFYPDHRAEIRKRALEFISDWFERTMGKLSWELAEEFIMPDGSVWPRQQVIEKMKLVFAAYTSFTDCQYTVTDVHYELKKDKTQGLGCVEGNVSYNAVLENGEKTSVEGTFRLFLTTEDGCWRIFYFIFPGFDWQACG